MIENNRNQLILSPKWLVPVIPKGVVLTDHSLVIQGEVIQDLLPRGEAIAKYPGYTETDLPEQVLTAGFINVHGHAAMTLLRGYADDKALMDWLNNYIWPIENQFASFEFVYDGTSLAIAEMIRGGTTCAIDSYFFPNASAEAYSKHGFRAQVSMPIIQFPTNWARDEAEHLHKALEVHNDIKNHPLIYTALAPHAPYTVTDSGFEKIVMYAEELAVPVHLHLHETATEVQDAVRDTGKRPIARLHELGVISSALQAVHMTQLNPEEIELLATNNVSVAHCPDSNLKLASGYCPVPDLMASGINVAVGTDGVASNNNLDMSAELRSAALLAKGLTGVATHVSAEDALAMGTINGAKLLGREHELGSLEIGKLADVIAIDLSDPLSQPVHNPISQIVYSTSGEQVSHVWIHGKAKLANRSFTDLDVVGVISKAKEWKNRMQL
jgi:5-methylthioadenosine/S-adenosylhomocysteine deaminase